MERYITTDIQLFYNQKTGDQATIDTTRGCQGCELKEAPCYAAKMARLHNINFFYPVKQRLKRNLLQKQLEKYSGSWIRVGCTSDPSLDWDQSSEVCEMIRDAGKIPVIITKLFNPPTGNDVDRLEKAQTIVHVSTSAISKLQNQRRRKIIEEKLRGKVRVVNRIVTMAYKNKKLQDRQEELIQKAGKDPICETPLRIFRTSPLWKLVNPSRYHRHSSPISGHLDNQLTAGLLIPGAFPCYSSCSLVPTETDSVGCRNQCCTREVKWPT